MAPKASPAFKALQDEQQLVNHYLWSSEIAHNIVQQRVLTASMRGDPNPIRTHFPNLKCNAFIPPANGKFASKYEKTAAQFEEHLRGNLEVSCKQVIVQFHRAFERFLTMRCDVKGLPEQRRIELLRYLKSGTSANFKERTRKLDVVVSKAVSFDYFLDARIYHEVRHDIAHADDEDSINVGDVNWSDKRVAKFCKANANWQGKPIFPKAVTPEQIAEAISRVCGGARAAHAKWQSEPLIFAYTLFCLGAYRRLAKEIDEALPPMEVNSSKPLTNNNVD